MTEWRKTQRRLPVTIFFAELMGALAISSRTMGIPALDALLAELKAMGVSPVIVALAAIAFVLWVPQLIGRFIFDYHASSITRESRLKERRMRRRLPMIIKIAVAFIVVLIVTTAAIGPWQAACLGAAKFSAGYGLAVAAMSLRSRRGRGLVCARCDYPMQSWRTAPPRCPECGNPWRADWRARIGNRATRWPTLLIGLALLALSTCLTAALVLWGF